MSTKRREKARKLKNADGVVICSCGCGQIPKPPRQTWFSNACVTGWREKNDPGYIRQQMLKRDKGICALCGCDTKVEYGKWCLALREALRLVDRLYNLHYQDMDWACGKWVRRPRPESFDWRAIGKRKQELLKKFSPPGNWTVGRRTGWDADHIVPVIEGGGLCEISAMRTLCHPCHKQVTKELAARRAARARQLRQSAE